MKFLRRILDREPRHRHASASRAQPVPDLPPSLAADVTDGDIIEARRAAFPATWRTRALAAKTRARGAGVGGHQHGQGRRRIGRHRRCIRRPHGDGRRQRGPLVGERCHPPRPDDPDGWEQRAGLGPSVVELAGGDATPAPAPPSLAGSAPLQSHEIFGYAPYWTLPAVVGVRRQDLTTLAYFSVDANPDGTLDESGAGWNGYESQDLANLVTRSHAAGDRVVLTVTCFSQGPQRHHLRPERAGDRLSAALIARVSAKNLDGVNFDFEGEGSADQADSPP